MHLIREAFKTNLIPDESLDVMIASLSGNTVKQYSVALKKWWSFCKGQNTFELSIPRVLKFLTERFQEGASYATLNSFRSALSLVIHPSLGTDHQIKRFFKGIYKLRPCRPKFNDTWDPSIVLKYIQCWSPVEDLNLEKLTKKVVILLALTSAQRIQTLSVIRLDNIVISDSGAKIAIVDLLKTTSPGKAQTFIKLPFFHSKPDICPVTTLQNYIDRTRELRNSDLGNAEKLIICFKKPHNYASTQTISRWIRQVLKDSGIDVKKFTPHSTRHASTSAASREGVTLDTIFKTAGWAQGSRVFANHYNRPLSQDNDKCLFAKAVCNIETD